MRKMSPTCVMPILVLRSSVCPASRPRALKRLTQMSTLSVKQMSQLIFTSVARRTAGAYLGGGQGGQLPTQFQAASYAPEKHQQDDLTCLFNKPMLIHFLVPNSLLLVKGLSFKPSGNYIVAPIFCFLRQRHQILATCSFFNFL